MEKRILLLDDDADILFIVREVLNYEGYQVLCVNNCADFYRSLAEWQPHLAILDFMLPDGNGGEICTALKANPETTHLPVIIFSAYASPLRDLSVYGGDAVIFKPFDISHLNDQVSLLLRTHHVPEV